MKIYKSLIEKDIFKDWKKEHQKAFLSHFFCPLDSKCVKKSSWEIAFYDSEKDKITVFVDDNIKKEDQVFKKENDQVEELQLDKKKISFAEAVKIFNDNLEKLFPKTILGGGFVVLQTIKRKTLWNFTFVTKTIQFINMKINSEDGNIESHQTVELVKK